MISLKDLKDHCRTCLVKYTELPGDTETNEGLVCIADQPDVEQLMFLCLGQETSDIDDLLMVHAPNMCRPCADKWNNYVAHQQLALKSDKILRKLLAAELNEVKEKTSNGKDKLNDVLMQSPLLGADSDIERYDITLPCSENSKSDNDSRTEDLNSLPEQSELHDEDDAALSLDETPILMLNHTVSPEISENKRMPKKHENIKLRYHCEPCNKYFFEIQNYEGHVKQIHKGIQNAYQCKMCDKAYDSYKDLGYHIAENHVRKSQAIHKCNECNKSFTTSTTLKQHVCQQHVVPKNVVDKHKQQTELDPPTICEKCGFLAKNHDTLEQHVRKKHTEAPGIKCDKCPKMFKCQYSLKYHTLSHHTNIKPYKCSECQQTFIREGLLNIHKRSHMRFTDRMMCEYEGCDVRFVKEGDRRHHVRLVHLKVKQHVCEYCGEAFGSMQTLRHHRFIHTGEKPYICTYCGQGFRQRTSMKTHYSTHFTKNQNGKTNENDDDACDNSDMQTDKC